MIPSLLYKSRRKNPLVHKGLKNYQKFMRRHFAYLNLLLVIDIVSDSPLLFQSTNAASPQ